MSKSKRHGWKLVFYTCAGVITGNWNALIEAFPEGSFNFAKKEGEEIAKAKEAA